MTGVDIELHYEGHDGVESVCDVLIEHGTSAILVTVTERVDNLGSSVTDYAEVIATQIAKTMPSASMPAVRFVEYHRCEGGTLTEAFDEVTFTWGGREASSPLWRHLGVDGYHQLRAELGIPTG